MSFKTFSPMPLLIFLSQKFCESPRIPKLSSATLVDVSPWTVHILKAFRNLQRPPSQVQPCHTQGLGSHLVSWLSSYDTLPPEEFRMQSQKNLPSPRWHLPGREGFGLPFKEGTFLVWMYRRAHQVTNAALLKLKCLFALPIHSARLKPKMNFTKTFVN